VIETRTHVTPLYPGAFFAEDGSPVRVAGPGEDPAALADVVKQTGWFCLEVSTRRWQKWVTKEGDVNWTVVRDDPTARSYRIYPPGSQVFTLDQVRALSDSRTLVANMQGNGWARLVRTPFGNYQPLEDRDVVLEPAAAGDPR
jgi:hypothetical protein